MLINKAFIVISLEISNVILSLYFYIIITAVYFFIFKMLKFKSHCNCNLNSMLLGYNSIAIKEQKQWDCGREECLYEKVRLWDGCSKWGKEINGDVKL